MFAGTHGSQAFLHNQHVGSGIAIPREKWVCSVEEGSSFQPFPPSRSAPAPHFTCSNGRSNLGNVSWLAAVLVWILTPAGLRREGWGEKRVHVQANCMFYEDAILIQKSPSCPSPGAVPPFPGAALGNKINRVVLWLWSAFFMCVGGTWLKSLLRYLPASQSGFRTSNLQ